MNPWTPHDEDVVVQRILLIEDNDLNRDMLARRLVRAGYEVVQAIDATAGLELAHTARPSLVLLDLRLPDMNGWDIARLLKQDPLTAHLPLIAITAHAMEGDRDKAIDAGCDDYDTKPVDLPRLLDKIRGQLSRAAQAPSLPPPDAPSRGADF